MGVSINFAIITTTQNFPQKIERNELFTEDDRRQLHKQFIFLFFGPENVEKIPQTILPFLNTITVRNDPI